jgi:NADH-quinone oxidoreductase subunit J
MSAEKILFLIFAVLAVAGGIGTITRRNVVHALLLLVFTFLNVAAIFFLTQAYFLAVIQILVYAGAIMVLFVFVIMLLNLRTFELQEQTHRRQRWIALLLSVLVLAEFVIVLAGMSFTSVKGGFTPEAISEAGGGTKVFGEALFNNMLLPFEVASVVLLVAMVGAIILVKREKTGGGATRAWEPGDRPTPEAVEEEV